jgi:hypothetical protein
MSALLGAIIAACTAYSSWVSWQKDTEIDRIEDEIDRLAAIGDAASKLRLERLAKRLHRKRERLGTL